MENQQTNLGVDWAVGVLRRRWSWVVLCLVLVTLGAFGFSKHQTKRYTATASLVFNNNQLGQQVAGLAVASATNQQAQQSTNLKLVQLGDTAQRTARALGHGLTRDRVRADLSVSPEGESSIVNIAATAPSPGLASEIANTYASEFVTEQQDSNRAYYASALAQVDRQLAAFSLRERSGAAGLALQDRAQSLATLAELHNGNVQVAQLAGPPTSPSAPKTSRNTVLGAVLGVLMGLAIAFLLERFDRRIREPKDLEEIYALPLLGVVPESQALSLEGRGKRDSRKQLSTVDAEAFQLIRAHLRYFNVDRELRTLLVASAAPGDGKSTVARHLAAAAASMGSRVLLLEVDLRRPTLARQLGVQPGPGLGEVLLGAIPLSEAVQSIDLGLPSSRSHTKERALDVLVAGTVLPPNPAELVESRTMESLLERAKSSYDLIVIDTPPLTAVSDAFPLLSKVDGVIVVGRIGRNRRDVAKRLHETLLAAGAPLLGVVANGFKAGRLGSYGYGYGYDYGTPPEHELPAVGPPGPWLQGRARLVGRG
jgi:capsular exopolysaccharide synthesis family protein